MKRRISHSVVNTLRKVPTSSATITAVQWPANSSITKNTPTTPGMISMASSGISAWLAVATLSLSPRLTSSQASSSRSPAMAWETGSASASTSTWPSSWKPSSQRKPRKSVMSPPSGK